MGNLAHWIGQPATAAQRFATVASVVDLGQSFWPQDTEHGRVADPEWDHAFVHSIGWLMVEYV